MVDAVREKHILMQELKLEKASYIIIFVSIVACVLNCVISRQ